MVAVTVAGSQVERDVDPPSVVRERLEAFAGVVLAEAMNRPVQRINGGLYLRGLIEDGAREGPDTRAIFDEQPGVGPIDRREHLFDQHFARRNDRADHHRVLQESAQELPLRAWAAAVAATLKTT